MRAASMALHAARPPHLPVYPTRAGVLRYFVEAKSVHHALWVGTTFPEFAALADTGLERTEALESDIRHMCDAWDMDRPRATGLHAGRVLYLARRGSPAFACHLYNTVFAHAAGGGRVIGEATRDVLDGWTASFYVWDGDVQLLVADARTRLDALGETWTPEQRAECVAETTDAFDRGLAMLDLMVTGIPGGFSPDFSGRG